MGAHISLKPSYLQLIISSFMSRLFQLFSSCVLEPVICCEMRGYTRNNRLYNVNRTYCVIKWNSQDSITGILLNNFPQPQNDVKDFEFSSLFVFFLVLFIPFMVFQFPTLSFDLFCHPSFHFVLTFYSVFPYISTDHSPQTVETCV